MNTPHRLLALAAVALACAAPWLSLSCTHRADGSLALTTGAEQGFLTAELDLCDALVPLGAVALPQPVGGAVAVLGPTACQGSEQALKSALDKVTALPAPDGGVFQSAAPLAFPIIRTARGYPVWHHSAHLGYVPTRAQAVAIASPQIQLFLDGLVDAGGEGGR